VTGGLTVTWITQHSLKNHEGKVAFERDRLKGGIGGIVLWRAVHLGRNAMGWFSEKTSIGGSQISNWVLVLAAVVLVWLIYSFAAR